MLCVVCREYVLRFVANDDNVDGDVDGVGDDDGGGVCCVLLCGSHC